MINIHDLPAVEQWCRQRKIDPQRLRKLRNAFYKRQRGAARALCALNQAERDSFAAAVSLHCLRLVQRKDSSLDGATKLIFHTAHGLALESVMLRMASGRTALCVSTQVGCAAHCDFCATGKMGLVRNLSADEILDQVIQANELLVAENRRVRNLVFMGMGEPFHNEEQLYQAIDVLADVRAFDFHLNRLLISTVGIPAAMIRCARRYPQVRLAVSLHSAQADVRCRLMPIAKRHGLAELREAILCVVALQRHPIMIEYLLLKEINDSPHDAQTLLAYLAGIPVHVNLIPYNPIAAAPHLASSEPERREQFAVILKAGGLNVTTRYSLGSDIGAACGQLAKHQQRSSANYGLAALALLPQP